jgi:prophage regulatory protein
MNEKYASDKDISARFGVSRQTIWRLVKSDPTFPKPIRLTAGCTRWQLSEVEDWETSKRTASK